MNVFTKSLLGVLLTVALVLGGCGEDDANEKNSKAESVTSESPTEAPDVTTLEPETPTMTTVEPEPPVVPIYEIELVKGGATEFTIVCDRADVSLRAAATEFSKRVRDAQGIDIGVTPLSEASGASGGAKEIIVGGVRDSGDALLDQLSGYNDFAIKVGDGTLTLAATNIVSYNYLFEYLYYEYFADVKNGSVVLDSGDDLIYSKSELSDKLYSEYHREKSGECESKFMLKCFESDKFNGSYGLNMPYRLYVPSNYDPEKEYPLFLFLHSAGHRGSDNDIAAASPCMYWLFNHKDPMIEDMIVLVPQCPSSMQWVDTPWSKGAYSVDAIPESIPMKTAIEIYNKVKSEYSVDESRQYVYGVSMGGFGTWDIITRHPDMFTAAFSLCGGGDPSKGEVLKNIPIWTVHSRADKSVPVSGTRDTVNAIKAAGGTLVTYMELATEDHNQTGWVGVKDEQTFKEMFAISKR